MEREPVERETKGKISNILKKENSREGRGSKVQEKGVALDTSKNRVKRNKNDSR